MNKQVKSYQHKFKGIILPTAYQANYNYLSLRDPPALAGVASKYHVLASGARRHVTDGSFGRRLWTCSDFNDISHACSTHRENSNDTSFDARKLPVPVLENTLKIMKVPNLFGESREISG